MLVLSRKQAESLSINGDVFVTVLRIRGNKVRLGIEAPKGTPVHRGEVYERIKDGSAESPPDSLTSCGSSAINREDGGRLRVPGPAESPREIDPP